MQTKHKLAGLVIAIAAWGVLPASVYAGTSIPTSSITPTTITFAASNPDTPTVPGSSSATVSFQTNGGTAGFPWTVQVQATAATFAGCPSTVPVSAVVVSCTSATVTGGTGGGSGACVGAFNLSTGLQTVASGTEGSGSGANRPTYTVTLSFSFADSWTYIPATCTANLNYSIIAN